MNNSLFVGLIQNAAFLMTLVSLQTLFPGPAKRKPPPRLGRVALGLVIGLLGISLIMSAYTLKPGIIFDTRSVLLGLSGLFFGTLPTVIAMLMTAALRLWQGGTAAGAGALVIFASGSLGLLWRKRLKNRPEEISWSGLYLLGLIVHVVMIALMFVMPYETAIAVVSQIARPVMLIYPAAFLATGLLLKRSIAYRRTTAMLTENEETYRNLFENDHAPMLLIDPDSGEIVNANPAATQLYGWSAETLRTMRMSQINTLPPEQATALMRRAQSGECPRFEVRHRRADGAEREVEVLGGPASIGGRRLLYSIVQDITQRKEEEAARNRLVDELRHSHEQMRTTLYSIGDAVVSVDSNGRIVFMNPVAEKLTGWPENEGVGQPLEAVFRIVNESSGEEVANPVAEALEQGTIVSLANHTLLLARDGRTIPIADSAAPILDEGRIQGAVLVFRDQTAEREARKALETSERNYSSLVANLPGIAYRCANNRNWTMEFISQGCEQLTGYAVQELVGDKNTPFVEIIHPEDREMVWNTIQTALEKRMPYEIEYRIVTLRKTEKWVWEKGGPAYAEDGTLLYLSGFISDITERKKNLWRLELTQFALDHAADPTFWINPADGSFEYVNDAACRSLGYSNEELMRLSVPDIDPDMPAWKAYKTRSGPKKELHFETRHRKKTGEIFPVEIHSNHMVFADEEYFFTFAHDLSNRKQTETRLRLLSTAIEQSSETVVITDAAGAIQYANHAFETSSGYSRNEALGKNPRILKSNVHDAAFYANLWSTLSSGGIWKGRFLNRKKDGSLYTEEATLSPVRNAAGIIVNYVAVKRDITDEVELEKELRHSQKLEAVGQLAGGVAHDFNNILQAISGFGQLLQFSMEEGSQDRANADEIIKAARRASKLTAQLLAFSRKEPNHPEPMDLNRAIADSEALIMVLLGDSHELALHLEEPLLPIMVDCGQISQVIMNLAINARDAMPEGGRLSIATENLLFGERDLVAHPHASPGSYVCLSVTDTGCGMNPSTRARIFEPFFTTKPLGKGSGLGLSVVYGIVGQSNGWISLYSEPNLGSTFNIYLPAIAPETTPAAITARAKPPTQSHGERILLVEDDAEVGHMVMEVLGNVGYRPHHVDSAEAALSLFSEGDRPFDLLMSDLFLPGIDGGALANAVRERHPGLPVLLYSGFRDALERWPHLKRRDYAFMHKPFTVACLLETVRNCLAQKNH